MSNLTPQDVDVRLTATRNELVEEDLRLWEGLEDEKISRIAGDEANKQLIDLVVDANQDTENRLSTEVLHRSEGDLSNVSSLTTLAQALSQYRIKTDLEIGNEKIARQQLGVDLTTRINSFVASWDHDKFLIYQSIQTVQLDVNNKYVSMDLRIKKYEDMLQDITMDSIQITMDSGEINMGAWTILSQAREWDLEILGKFKDYKHDTDQGIDEALKDIQDKLPVVEDIINKAIEQLSNAPIIQALDERIGSSEITIDGVTQTVMQHQIDNQNEMIKLAKSLADQVVAESESLNEQLTLETTTRIDALVREAAIRAAQLEQEALDRSAEIDAKVQVITIDVDQDITNVNNAINELNAELDIQVAALNTLVDQADAKATAIESNVATQVTNLNNKADSIRADLTAEENARIIAISGLNDGLTQEIQFRKDGDTANIAALENYKTSNDAALANVRVELGANITATTANAAKITSLDTRLVVNETLAASAVSKAETALTQNTAMAVDITSVKASITGLQGDLANKADADAFNQLKAQVTNIDGKVTTQASDITALQTTVTSQGGAITANTSAISQLETVQTSQGSKITQLSTDTSSLRADLTVIEDGLETKVDNQAFNELMTRTDIAEGKIDVHSSDITSLQTSLATTNNNVATKASAASVTALDSKVTSQGNTITSQGTAITKLTNDLALTNAAAATKADASALTALDSKVTGIGGRVTSNSKSITALGNKITAVEGAISTKAEATAVNALTTRVTTIEGVNTSQGTSITKLTNDLATTNTELTTKASSAALSALDSKVTTQAGITTSQGAAITKLTNDLALTDTAVAKKAEATALSALDTKVTGQGNTLTSQGTAITKLTTDLSTLDTKVNTKANSTVVSYLDSKVTSIEGTVTSQGTSLTSLTNRVELAEGNINKKADSSAVTSLGSKVTQQGLDITSQGASITRIDAAIDATNLAVATKASAAALSTLDSKVTSIDGKVSSTTSAITALTGRVTATEGALTTKASVDAVNSLTTRITSAEGTIASQTTSITSLNSGLVTTNTKVTAAQTAANNANTLAGGKGKVFFQNAEPAVADRLVQNLWIDTTGNNNTPKRWLTNAWVAVNDKIATDALTAANAANVAIATKADASALSSLDSKVTSINGTVTSQGVSITNLNTRLSSAEGALTTKANSSAVSALDTKVTQQGNTITSQGTDITKLKADLALTNTAVSTKASSEALQSLDNRVVSIDGKVTTNASSITALNGKMTTVENGLATKANGSALSALTTRVSNAEGELSSQSSKVTKLEADVGNTSTYIISTSRNGGYREGGLPWGLYNATLTKLAVFSRGFNLAVWANDGSYSSVQRFDTYDSTANIASLATALLALPVNTYFTLVGADNIGTASALQGNVELKNFIIANGGSASYYSTWGGNNLPIFTSMVGTGTGTGIQHSFNSNVTDDWIKYPISLISGIPEGFAGVQPIDESKFATASAISILDSKVTNIDGVVTGHSTQLSNLTASIAGKANTSALNSLTARVKAEEGKSSSQATSITNLNSSVDNALKAVTVSDTRSTNQPPSWYWSNYTRRVVNEFKTQTVIGVDGFFGGTYCNLETKVYYSDPSGGDIIQTATSSVDPSLYVQRRSSGTAAWTAWAQPIKDLRDSLVTKASASAVNTLATKVTAIDGKVSANANDLTVLKGTVDNNQSYIINNYYTKADANNATANQITQFESTLSVGGRNLVRNTVLPVTGDGWLFQEKLTRKIQGEVTITWEVVDESGAPANGGIGFNYGDSGSSGYEFIEYPSFATGKYKITKTTDSGNYTHFGMYSNTRCTIKNVKIEDGSIPSTWTPAPEDSIQEIEAQATAIKSLTTQVINIDGRVSSTASQVLTLESFKSGIQNGEIPGNSIREINLTDPSYGQDTYFPVILSGIPTTTRTHLSIVATLDSGAKPSWASHLAGFSVNVAWDVTGAGWGTTVPDQVINNAVWKHCVNDVSPIMDVTQDGTSSQPLVWLRGGGRYYYSVPLSRSIAICPAYGTLTSSSGNVFIPRLFDANLIPVSLKQNNEKQTVRLQQTNQVVDGVKAVSTISVDNNGFMSGYGLISQLVNGVVTSAFGINADYFYVGNSNANKKKPFMVLTSPQAIGGVTYPAGTWMDVALIANATIGTAHIQDASITNAKIASLSAEKITAGIISADRIGANSITAEKVTIGTGANLWAQPLFQYLPDFIGRSAQFGYTPALRGWGVQCLGRDHIAPWSTRITVKGGEQYVIEYTAGHNAGPIKSRGVGFWYTDVSSNMVGLSYPAGEVIGDLGNGWYKYRTTITVPESPSLVFAMLFIQIEQSETESNPMYWTVGNVAIRRVNGGELIVNGAITADKLYSNTVSGMFANFGRFESNVAGVGTTVISGPTIEVYDTQRLRVFIGVKP